MVLLTTETRSPGPVQGTVTPVRPRIQANATGRDELCDELALRPRVRACVRRGGIAVERGCSETAVEGAVRGGARAGRLRCSSGPRR